MASESFAHTSAVYVEAAGYPVRSPEDAEYFIRWIDRLWQDVRKRNRIPTGQQPHVEKQIAAGEPKTKISALENFPGFPDFHLPLPNRLSGNLGAAYDELTEKSLIQ